MTDETVTACLIVIGNEILSGRTRDANLAFIGARLNEVGIRLAEARVIPDVEDVIVEAVNEVRRRFVYVFTTGGIGPTHDDITAASVAKAFGVPLIQNPAARALLEARYEPGMLNEARLRMANTPKGARLIENPVSTAPGFQIGNVFVMAGVPTIMRAMFEGVVPRLVGGNRCFRARSRWRFRKGPSPGTWAPCRTPTRTWRWAAIPSAGRGVSAPVWSCARAMRHGWRRPRGTSTT